MICFTRETVAIMIIVVVVIIIVIFIAHALVIRKSEGNGGRVFVEKSFSITVGPKSTQNKFHSVGFENCFYINGVEAPALHLSRGVYYEFVNNSDEPFYFTTDSTGGIGSPGSINKKKSKDFIGLANGTIFFKTTDDLPDTFYYQSGAHENMGSAIVLH